MKTVEILTEYHTDTEQPTLRDRFAMAAITGVIAPTQGTWNAIRAAQSCYQIADAMLLARKDGGE